MCASCQRPPCGSCRYCLDSPKFGGTGHLKQSCIHRKCEQLLIHENVTMEMTCNTYAHPSTQSIIVPPEEPAGCTEDASCTILVEVVINPHQCMEEGSSPLAYVPQGDSPYNAKLQEHHLDVYVEDMYRPPTEDGTNNSSVPHTHSFSNNEGIAVAHGLEEVMIVELEPQN